MDAAALEMLLACLKATSDLKLCPNRVWAVAGINLPKLLPNFNPAPTPKSNQDRPDQDKDTEQNTHELCAYDFCEFSQRDFTAVQQRHECREANCIQLDGRFPRNLLEDAVWAGQPTVWNLKGDKLLEPCRPYMAISHVWSDGTGVGAWKDGQVNECLYMFFRDIAEQFQCEGIWWDTICIPNEKKVRTKATRKIHENYQDAQITLVHDCFLRNWQWNPDTACFGILMSPWFSRGWTALELANSRKVKVIFKGPHGPVIKDLDEQILAKVKSLCLSTPREEATRIIQLIRGTTFETKDKDDRDTLNNLLKVLGPRHTSWPKDMAVISALLSGIRPMERQQDTYQCILRKCRWISPGHMFHSTATMSQGYNWCPTSLFNMPLDDFSQSSLEIVSHDGDIRGTWRLRHVDAILDKHLLWKDDMHSVAQLHVRAALASPKGCRLLAERGSGPVERALLVKASEQTEEPHRYEYVGAVFFRLDLPSEGWREVEVIISGNASREDVVLGDSVHESQPQEHTSISLHDAVWRGQHGKVRNWMAKDAVVDEPDPRKRTLLHLAAERGDELMVGLLLTQPLVWKSHLAMPCGQGRTAIHYAAWSGSRAVVESLLNLGSDTSAVDEEGNLPIHIASRMGFDPVVSLLLRDDEPRMNARGCNGLTPIHYAAMNGHHAVVLLLVERGADLAAKDDVGWMPLHYAASSGDKETTSLLIKHHVDIDIVDDKLGWTPLHFAAMNGNHEVVKILKDNRADMEAKDKYGWTPRRFADINGYEAVLHLLQQDNTDPVAAYNAGQWTPLHLKAVDSPRQLLRLLASANASGYLKGMSTDWSPLPFAAKNGLFTSVCWLLDIGANVEEQDEDGRTSLSLAAEQGHDSIVQLLLVRKAKVDSTDNSGRTPLEWAARGLQSSTIQRLRKYGADINESGWKWQCQTALSRASEAGDEAVVQLLIANGADVNANDMGGENSLDKASKNGHEAVLKVLLNNGAKSGRNDRYGWALHTATKMGHKGVVRLLVAHGADVNHLEYGGTVLNEASKKGDLSLIKLFLDNGADNRYSHWAGDTALYHASCHGHIDVVKFLLDRGATVNPKASSNQRQQTPLASASEKGHMAIVQLLLDHGAKIDNNNLRDRKAMETMAKRGQGDISKLLTDEGIDILPEGWYDWARRSTISYLRTH